MSIPYTYYLYNKTTHQHYYGARWASNCHPSDLWVTYFTSSKKVKKLIEQYGLDSFTVEVRKTFNTVDSCRAWENKVLKRLKVLDKQHWLNQSYGTPYYLKGIKWSDERKAKAIGKTLSEEHKLKISKAHLGKKKPQTEEHKKNAALARTGLKHGPAPKVVCPHCRVTTSTANAKRWHFDKCHYSKIPSTNTSAKKAIRFTSGSTANAA